MPGRYVSDPARNHSSKHGSDTADANEYMIHHSATAWSVWAASQVLSRPSCRHIRSTCLWFTLHPSFLSIAVILRYP